nr:4Fe-4S binding protein [candidate division Zixibacteria bacterium]
MVSKKPKILLYFVLLCISTAGLSFFSAGIWGEKPETLPETASLTITQDMTLAEFGHINNISNEILKKAFNLESKQDLQKSPAQLGLSHGEIISRVEKARAISSEYESKNWLKIPIKFALWFAFLITVFILMRRGRINYMNRKWYYLAAIIIFGIILGSDPSPMGTIKDAIVLLGASGVIFPPRMIALTIFLILVFLANKYICSWGCQFGVLQDLVFRINRSKKDRRGIFRQYKPSFAVLNTIRIIFFAVFTVVAFLWGYDIISLVDPFRIFHPVVLAVTGGLFIAAILIAALFIYRPWCSLFCPFGLTGWLVEKISLFKIRVDYDSCIACEACSRACPSTVMEAILKREKVIPDCFACGTCIETCPTNSIGLRSGKRTRPPEGKFADREKKEVGRKLIEEG